jgi:hypothetical protein
MTEEVVEEVVTAEGGGVEAEANLSGGIDAKIDMSTDATPEDVKDPLERVKEKYSHDINKLAEAYRHAEKKISQGQYEAPEAPEDYKYSFEVEGLDADLIKPDDPLLAKMTDVFRENKLPQDTADSLVNAFLEYEMSMQPNLEEEIAKLGSKGNDMLERLTNFSTANLEEDSRAAFDQMATNADQVKVLHQMVEMMGEQPLADPAIAQGPAKSAQEYLDEAFEYRAKHGEALAWDKGKQSHYEGLIKKANTAKS